MNPVKEALRDGVSAQVLKVAAHEIGHALVWRHAGIAIREVRLSRGWFGGISDAFCRPDIGDVTKATIDPYLTGLMGGAAATARFVTTFQGAWLTSGREGSAADIDTFRWYARRVGSRLSIGAAQGRARSILAGHASRLDRFTVELARTGRLSGWSL